MTANPEMGRRRGFEPLPADSQTAMPRLHQRRHNSSKLTLMHRNPHPPRSQRATIGGREARCPLTIYTGPYIIGRIRTLYDSMKQRGNSEGLKILAEHLAEHPDLQGFQGWIHPVSASTQARDENSIMRRVAKILVDRGIGRGVIKSVNRVTNIRSAAQSWSLDSRPTVEEQLATLAVTEPIPEGPILLLEDLVYNAVNFCAHAKLLRDAGVADVQAAALVVSHASEYGHGEAPWTWATFKD